MEGEYVSSRSGRGAKIKKKKNHQKNVIIIMFILDILKDKKKIKQYKI